MPKAIDSITTEEEFNRIKVEAPPNSAQIRKEDINWDSVSEKSIEFINDHEEIIRNSIN